MRRYFHQLILPARALLAIIHRYAIVHLYAGNVLIGDDCVVGNSVEVKNAIIFDNVQIPHYNYVGDSVLVVSCPYGGQDP